MISCLLCLQNNHSFSPPSILPIMDHLVKTTKVLVVDDDAVNHTILSSLLKKQGYVVLSAVNGKEAIEMFEQESPDLVLMDILMPDMNGYEAARIIKERSYAQNKFIPVMFITAVTDEDALSKCVESGGDDFLTKPFNGIILQAKINALQRIKALYSTLHQNQKQLEHYRASVEHELEFADHILDNVTSKANMDLSYVKRWTSSLSPSAFSGDIFFVARKPSGGMHLMLCDFSGHGLPAAVGALPVSEVFLAMTHRGFSTYEILLEINKKLNNDLPTGFFCAAVFLDIDYVQGFISVVNAGLPGCFYIDVEKGEFRTIESNQLPLGISIDSVTQDNIEVMEIKKGSHLLVYTDGVSEVMNGDGELFGYERAATCVKETIHNQGDLIDTFKAHVKTFCGGEEPKDDISVIDLDCYAAAQDIDDEEEVALQPEVAPAEWKVEFDLSIAVLKSINPVPLLLNAIRNLQLSSDHRKRIFTILSELYNNALDHGLLKLDSSLKHSADGFMRYHQEKQARLANLEDGWAKIRVEHVKEQDEFVIKINVSNTGEGFHYEHQLGEVEEETLLPSGRGIRLIRSIAQSLEYHDGGRIAEVKYTLQEVDA